MRSWWRLLTKDGTPGTYRFHRCAWESHSYTATMGRDKAPSAVAICMSADGQVTRLLPAERETTGVADGDGLNEGEGDSVGVGLGVALGVGVEDGLGEGLVIGVGVDVGCGVAAAGAVGLGEGVDVTAPPMTVMDGINSTELLWFASASQASSHTGA